LKIAGDRVRISNLGLFSFTSGGSADPRTFNGINATGTSGAHVNGMYVENVFAQGWLNAAYLQYIWSSQIIGFATVNTNNGVVFFGQSVNNSVVASNLIVNGGNASVVLTPNGSDTGEGLMISDTLMSSGTYGVTSGTGFLSLDISNCTIDLISNTGVNLTDAKSTRITNSWIYATTKGVSFNDLGSLNVENSSVSNTTITVTSASGGMGIYLGSLNRGFSITGNSITVTGTNNGVYSNATNGTIVANNFTTSGSVADIYINTSPSTHWIAANTGVTTITGGAQAYYQNGTWTPADASGAGLTFTSNGQAYYVKNGQAVTASFDITYPSTANGSNASITLPIAPIVGAPSTCTVGFQTLGSTFTVGTSSGGVAQIFMYSTAAATLTNANLSTKRLNVTCNYIATN